MKRPHLDVMLKYVASLQSPIIVDVGAHVGKITGMMLDACPTAVVYAIEPDPESYKILYKQYGDSIIAVQAAVSDKDGFTKLYRMRKKERIGASQGNTIIRGIAKAKKQAGDVADYDGIVVRCLKPETLFRGLDRINLMKLNCEGAERYILDNPVMLRTDAVYISQHDKMDEPPSGFRVINKTWKKDHSWEFWKR